MFKSKMENLGYYAPWFMLLFSVGVCLVLAFGCHDGCETETTRCNGDRIEICNTEQNWELEADCSEIEDFGLGLDWTCCLDPEDDLHSCLPKDECEMDADVDAVMDGGV